MSVSYPTLPLTSFPEVVDTFQPFVDMSQTDYALVKQYQAALESGNTVQAQQILNQIPQATQKVVFALRLNQLREAILAMEQFYSEDIVDYTNSKQTEWNAYVDRFEYKGVYNPTTSYVKNNFVQFTASGVTSLYINIYNGTTPIGVPPTSTTYWKNITVRGEQGESGSEGTTFDYDWSSSKSYNIDTIVVYENKWWVAIEQNQNQPPFEGSTYWEKVLSTGQALYPVQEYEPAEQANGELWFKVLGV